jgi:16S rRNA (cytosine1402-N4)-methyltransferase
MGSADSSRRKRRVSSPIQVQTRDERPQNDFGGPVVHVSVLLTPLLEALRLGDAGRYIDATVGLGGHTEALLKASTGAQVLGIDADPAAVARSSERLRPYGHRAMIVQGNFRNLDAIARGYGFSPVDAVLFDLGISSLQLSAEGHGFSFQHAAGLDMRMDPGLPLTAADLVNEMPESQLVQLLYRYGEEPRARSIARAIVQQRPHSSTVDLARVVSGAAGGQHSRTHPATRTFQALRIAVNDELQSLSIGLRAASALLRAGGRLAVISFHSLEDRIVKEFFHSESRDCICPPALPVCVCSHQATLRLPSRSALKPTETEIALNPRARSAKLRVAERI